jgi:hypothetical protein
MLCGSRAMILSPHANINEHSHDNERLPGSKPLAHCFVPDSEVNARTSFSEFGKIDDRGSC